MAAVRRGTEDEQGKVTDHSKIRPPTDATQSRSYLLPLIHSALDAVIDSVIDSVLYLETAISRSTRSATRSAPPASPSPSTEAFHFFQRAQSPVKASAMIARAEAAVRP